MPGGLPRPDGRGASGERFAAGTDDDDEDDPAPGGPAQVM